MRKDHPEADPVVTLPMQKQTAACNQGLSPRYAARIPPSTGMIAPVIHDEASESR